MSEHPDVAELIARNRETCDHPKSKREARSVAVGSGMPGVMGCHMETRWFCAGCDKAMPGGPELDELLEKIRPAKVEWPKPLESACTCGDGAPIGGHNVACPRFGRRPL